MYGVTGYFGNPLLPIKVGNGKTLWLVNELYNQFLEGKTVYTNLNLKFEHVKINSFFDILKHNLGNCVVGVDEIKNFLGTKYTGLPSDLKDDILGFISQQRKRKIPFIYTNQEFNTAPLFLREETSFFYVSHKIHPPTPIPKNFLLNISKFSCLEDDTDCFKEHIFIAEPINVFGGKNTINYKILEGKKKLKTLYKLYDTYQIIDKIEYNKIYKPVKKKFKPDKQIINNEEDIKDVKRKEINYFTRKKRKYPGKYKRR